LLSVAEAVAVSELEVTGVSSVLICVFSMINNKKYSKSALLFEFDVIVLNYFFFLFFLVLGF
jgi:hypothetical protein